MKYIYKLSSLAVVLLLVFSCTDDNKQVNFLDDLPSGGFIQFSDLSMTGNAFPADFSSPNTGKFSASIEDLHNNVKSITYSVSYEDAVRNTILKGENFLTITSFPATLEMPFSLMADAIGIPLDDIQLGETLTISSVVTRNDDVTFSSAAPKYDPDTELISGGDTSEPLRSEVGYRDAMSFDLVLSCPFDQASTVGTYTVESLGFSGFFGEPGVGTTREVLAGPGENQITIVGGTYPTAGDSDDLIVTVNPSSGVASYGGDDDDLELGPNASGAAAGFSPQPYGTVTGFVLSCTGVINLVVDFGGNIAGNRHPFVLKKN